MDLNYATVPAAAAGAYLGTIAELRIQVFREWPYLYDGDLVYEEKYLRDFSGRSGAVVVLARSAGEVVGASTAMPLATALPEFRAPFAALRLPMDDYYYLGESVLLPGYRGLGAGRRFFAEREAAARNAGCRFATFCAVQRDANDPRRPDDYRALAPFWQRLGYRLQPDCACILKWKIIDSDDEVAHHLNFWTKSLAEV